MAAGNGMLNKWQAGSSLLGRMTGASTLEASILNKAITTGIAGGGAGILDGTTDAVINERPLDVKQLVKSGYAMAFTGGAMSIVGGKFMKLNTEQSRFPSVEEYVARKYDGANDVPGYQAWLAKQSLNGKTRYLSSWVTDTVREKTSDLLARATGNKRSATESATETAKKTVTDSKYGDLTPDQQRLMKLTLPELSPTERLLLVRQLERLGKNPMLNESSLYDLHSRLTEVSKSWQESRLPDLLKAKQESHGRMMEKYDAKVLDQNQNITSKSGEVSAAHKAHKNALEEWQTSKTAYETAVDVRTQQLLQAINPWLKNHGLPALELQNTFTGYTGEYIGAYLLGKGRIDLTDKLMAKPKLEADLFDVLFHEIVHLRQDVLRIKLLADQMGIGKTASPEQLNELNHKQLLQLQLDSNSANLQEFLALPFTQRVLDARSGKRLTAGENREASTFSAEIKAPDPSWAAEAAKVRDQIGRTSFVTKADPINIGRILEQINLEPGAVKSDYGFSTIPKRLIALAQARVAPEVAPWHRPDALVVAEVASIFKDQSASLQQLLKPYLRKEYERYIGSFAEGQVYPAGLLAHLFAHNLSLPNKSPVLPTTK